MNKEEKEFWVECSVCKTQLKDHVGSTPCCGALAFLVEDNKVTSKALLHSSSGIAEINFKAKD